MKEVPSLYFLKAVCAILIVFIHLPGISVEATVMQPLMRIGVPCFFMITGYFLYKNDGLDRKYIGRTIFKVLKLTVFISIVYAVVYFALSFPPINRTFPLLENIGNPKIIRRMILVGDVIDSVFWYLTAVIEALAVIWFLLYLSGHRRTVIVLAWATPFLLVAAVLLNRYSFIVSEKPLDIMLSRNFLFAALPCISLGILTRKWIGTLARKKNTVLVTALLILILSYGEYWMIHVYDIDGSGADFNLLTFPLSLSFFVLFCVNPDFKFLHTGPGTALVTVGKHDSADLYLYHSLAFNILSAVAVVVPVLAGWLNAELVIVLLLVTFYIVRKVRKQ